MSTDQTEIHDTHTCPCEMCVWARRTAANKPKSPSKPPEKPERDAGFLVPEAKNVSSSLLAQDSPISAPTFTEEWESAPRAMIRYVEQDRLRAVLFDVIDGGCTCDSGEQHPWELDDDPNDPEMTEDIVNAQRVRFVDEVMGRLLISPSIAEYWFLRGVRAGEAGAMVTMNEDLREIKRVAGERLTTTIREGR